MKQRHSEAGFSLVEVMMVVAIIGLMTSAVVLFIPPAKSSLKDALGHTERAFIALSRQSVLTGQVLGARFSDEGFNVYALTENGWKIDDAILKPDAQKWQSFHLSGVRVDGYDVDFQSEKKDEAPHLWFLPTGEHPAFQLTLVSEGGQGVLASRQPGHFEVQINE